MNYNNSDKNYEEYFRSMSKYNEGRSCDNYEKYNNGYIENHEENLEENFPNINLDLQNSDQLRDDNAREQNIFQWVQNDQYNQEFKNTKSDQGINRTKGIQQPIQFSGNFQGKNLNKAIQIPGQVRKCNLHCNINGKNYSINNKNFYNRYFTRYNHFFINDCNYIKDHLSDCNIYHFTSQTIYKGCKYLGSHTVIAKKCYRNFNNKCCFNCIF